MRKLSSIKECPQCGSKYLDIEQDDHEGVVIITCGECGEKIKAQGRPPKKHEIAKKDKRGK